jgi:pyridoxine 4-dehydrogenase
VIVTKLGGARRDDASWYSALAPAELRAGCEHDLRLLKLESVPIAHLRWINSPGVSFEDALGTLVELRDEGKIEHIGLSTVDESQLAVALSVTPVATVSNAYSVLDRTDEALLTTCEREGIAFLPYFPLGASPLRSGAGVTDTDVVGEVAGRLGVAPTQLAIAWLLARSPVIVPIPGTSQVAHLEENVGAAELRLSAEDLALLDTAG